MISSDRPLRIPLIAALTLPSTEELPCSDDIPVDNEDQNFLPNLLLFMLIVLRADRMDWYFGVDMAVYHTTGSVLGFRWCPMPFLAWVWSARKEESLVAAMLLGKKMMSFQPLC